MRNSSLARKMLQHIGTQSRFPEYLNLFNKNFIDLNVCNNFTYYTSGKQFYWLVRWNMPRFITCLTVFMHIDVSAIYFIFLHITYRYINLRIKCHKMPILDCCLMKHSIISKYVLYVFNFEQFITLLFIRN